MSEQRQDYPQYTEAQLLEAYQAGLDAHNNDRAAPAHLGPARASYPILAETVIQRIRAKRIEIATTFLVGRVREDPPRVDMTSGAARHSFRSYMVGILDHKTEKREFVPMTWWDHFKSDPPRWVPAWVRRHWQPVKFREIVLSVQAYKAVCPHLDVEDGRNCVEFLRASL